MITIKIIAGSTRPGRFNPQPAHWMLEQTKKFKDDAVNFELIDLVDLDLPVFDEVNTPLSGKYEKPYTKKWAKLVGEADGFIMVTPEYNHSIPGALKNAIDYLYAEWNYKPIAYVSYGSLAGGSRAVEHLRGIAAEQKMFDLREQIMLPNYWNNMNETGQYQFTDEQESQAAAMIDQVVFWAKHMQKARKELQA